MAPKCGDLRTLHQVSLALLTTDWRADRLAVSAPSGHPVLPFFHFRHQATFPTAGNSPFNMHSRNNRCRNVCTVYSSSNNSPTTKRSNTRAVGFAGALKIQDLTMTDQKRRSGKYFYVEKFSYIQYNASPPPVESGLRRLSDRARALPRNLF